MTTPYSPGASIPTGSSVPVDSSGALDVWNLPTWVHQYEQHTDKTPFFVGTHQQTVPGSPSYSMGEHSGSFGGNYELSPGEHSGSYSGPPSTTKTVPSYASAEDIMKNFAAMAVTNPTQFADIQHLLLAGGWYGPVNTKVQYGFTPQTEDALGQAMIQYLLTAHGAGIPVKFEDFLASYAQHNAELMGNIPGQAGAGQTPSVVQLTDPATLVRYAQMAAQSALGRAFNHDELNRFVTEFHEQQLQNATETTDLKAGAKGAGVGGVVGMVDKSDPRSAALEFAQNGGNQPEFARHQIQGYTDAFLNMFLPNASAAPNVNTDVASMGY